jgi:hypothetical protein
LCFQVIVLVTEAAGLRQVPLSSAKTNGVQVEKGDRVILLNPTSLSEAQEQEFVFVQAGKKKGYIRLEYLCST